MTDEMDSDLIMGGLGEAADEEGVRCPSCRNLVEEHDLLCGHCGHEMGNEEDLLPPGEGEPGGPGKGPKRLGDYKICRKLGQGGMGRVYLAWHETGEVEVAIKLVPPEVARSGPEMEEVKRNYQLVQRLHHPHLASVKTLESLPRRVGYFLVMEYVAGTDLERYRKALPDGTLESVQAIRVVEQVAQALDYAHENKVVHRDVKPGNIMLTPDGKVKVTDFGLASQIRSSLTKMTGKLTATGAGTRPYMAPEQWEGGGVLDGRVDQWALAVMFYELVSGQLPFFHEDVEVLRLQILRGEVEPLAQLDANQNRALQKAMSKRREDRFATCTEFIRALQGEIKVIHGHGGAGWKRKATVLAAAAVILGAGAWYWLARGGGKVLGVVAGHGDEKAGRVAAAGRVFLQVGKYAEGIARLEEATKLKPGDAGWQAELVSARERWQTEKERRAAELGRRLAEAKAFLEVGDFSKAIQSYQEVLKEEGGNREATEKIEEVRGRIRAAENEAKYREWFKRGLAKYLEKEWGNAVEAFRTAQGYRETEEVKDKIRSAQYQVAWARAAALEGEGKVDEALGWYGRARGYEDTETVRKKIAELESRRKFEQCYGEGKKKEEGKEWEQALASYREAEKYADERRKPEIRGRIARCEAAVKGKQEEAVCAALLQEGKAAAGEGNWEKAKGVMEKLSALRADDPEVKRLQAEIDGHSGPAKEWTNTLGMKLVRVPAGEFSMGSPKGEKGRDSDEGPQHPVRVARPFFLGSCEVTQEEYEKVMGKNPGCFKGPQHPVEQVSWNDAVAFCEKLSRQEGRTYRLPTEAEWEYACRAGSTSRFCYGEEEGRLGEYAWVDANAEKMTHPVGAKQPNAWGLYDMHGNVWEWCSDWYGNYDPGTQDDPKGAAGGSSRVNRGGGWFGLARFARSASRDFNPSSSVGNYLGFRVVLEISAAGNP